MADGQQLLNRRYRLVRHLGAGATGDVYLAEDTSSGGRRVALKTLREGSLGEEAAAGLRQEFAAMARLRHPHLLAVHDFGTVDGSGKHFLTMDYVDGCSLRDIPGPHPPEVLLRLLVPLAQVLDYLHARGYVHHDLKPANVLLGSGEIGAGPEPPDLRVADLGLAALVGSSPAAAGGTLRYLAPEKLRGDATDPRSDLYSLGATLFFLATGQPPFHDPSGSPLVHRILSEPAPDPALLAPGLPEGIRTLIQRLMDPDPGRRPPSAAAVLETAVSLGGGDDPRRTRLERRGRLVGRAQEWAVLAERIARVSEAARRDPDTPPDPAGHPLVVIRGEAGVGKSRLLEEIRVEAQLAGLEVAQADFAAHAASPLGPWPGVLRFVAGRMPEGSISGDGPWTALLDDPEDDRRGPVDPSGEREPSAARQRALSAVVGLLRAAANAMPLAILMEDLSRAGPQEVEILRRLAAGGEVAPVLLVATASEEDLPGSAAAPLLDSLAGLGRLRQIPLGRLPEADVGPMVASLLGGGSPPPALVERLFRLTDGNPFFVEEITRYLVEIGALRRGPEGWRLEGPQAMAGPLPSTVSDAVRNRMRRLAPEARRVMEILAVAGGPCSQEEIAAVGGLETDAVRAWMADLAARGLAVERRGGRHDLGHGMVRAVVERACPARRRRDLHLRFAERLARRRGVPSEDLARHFHGAGDGARALPHYRRAAQQARRMHDPERALANLSRALALAGGGRSLERAALEAEAGAIQEEVGASGRAREAYRRALAATPRPVGAREEARLRERMSWNAALAGDYPSAEEESDRALERFRQAGDRAGEAETLKNRGIILSRQGEGRRQAARQCFENALAAFEALGSQEGVASVLNNLGLLQAFSGDHAAGAELLERALRIREATRDRRKLLGTLVNLGFVRVNEGHGTEWRQVLDRSVTLARELGDQQNLGNALMFRARGHRRAGALDRALEDLAAALRVHQETGDVSRQIHCHDDLGEILRTIGDLAQAAAHHGRALDLARHSGDPMQVAYARASLSLDEIGLGEPTAVQALEEAREAAAAAGNLRVEARALRGLALVEAMRGNAHGLAARADRLILVAEGAGLPEERAWGLRLLGEARLRSGAQEEGRRALEEACRAAAALGCRDLQREILLLLAGSLERGGRIGEAVEAREEAQGLLEEMAMAINDEKVRSALQRRAHQPAAPPPGGRDLSVPTGSGSAGGSTGRGMGALYDISQTIHSVLDPEELLDRVMDIAIEKLQADRGMLILFDGPDNEMRVRVARNLERETVDDALAYSRHVVQEAAEGRAVMSYDAAQDDRFKDFRSVRMYGIRSLLCVPLRFRGRVVGTVYLDARRPGVTFQDSDLRFAELFADMAALALHTAREFDGLRRRIDHLEEELKGRFSYRNIVGRSEKMQKVFDILERVAGSTLPVLIHGESGTGKELVARAIHFNGPRRDARFFSENCAALSETLLESELFGHVRGAFTGADVDRQGLFELASGGTLFLDEIGDMSVGMQGKVLRAIQEGEIRPVGGKRTVKVDVRILSATNHDLDLLLAEGRFREDLYYRLNVVKLTLPPLRDRKEDIPLLVDHFLAKAARESGGPVKQLDEEALRFLARYHWPGNVRELENEVYKLAVFSEGDTVTVDDLHRHEDLFDKLTQIDPESPLESMEEMERRQIERALQETGGHRGNAARLLGISRATIFRKIKHYGISR